MYLSRRENILSLLHQKPNMTVKTLADQLNVSEMTVRRDLVKMEGEGIVRRVFGGVTLASEALAQHSAMVRGQNGTSAKRRMANLANQLIPDGESVLLDSGTTILELAKLLLHRPVYIATSSIPIALSAGTGTATVHVSGGKLDGTFQTLTGPTAENFYETINCKYAFVSAGGVSIKRGITEYTEGGAALKNIMLKHSKIGVLMVDRSKLDVIQMFRGAPLEDIDIIISDQPLPEEYTRFCDDHGIEIKIAGETRSTEETPS